MLFAAGHKQFLFVPDIFVTVVVDGVPVHDGVLILQRSVLLAVGIHVLLQ